MHVNLREILRKSICAALCGVELYRAAPGLIGAACPAASPRRTRRRLQALVCSFPTAATKFQHDVP